MIHTGIVNLKKYVLGRHILGHLFTRYNCRQLYRQEISVVNYVVVRCVKIATTRLTGSKE